MTKMILEPREEWLIQDSTKIDDYLRCERKYFFKHILGWEPEDESFHRVYGRAMHKSLAILTKAHVREREELVASAITAFNLEFEKVFPQWAEGENDFGYKSSKNIGTVLIDYVIRYSDDDFTNLFTEIGGSVPILGNRRIYFLMDSINFRESNEKYSSLEHKTGSKLSRSWRDQWRLSIQVGTYTHVLHCLYPRDKVEGVVVNGIILTKQTQFERVPVERSLDSMDNWLWTTSRIVDNIEADIARLELQSQDEVVMTCFKQNPTSCTDFFGCEYWNICIARPNPLVIIDELPFGMKVRFWDPRKEEVTHKIDLEKYWGKE